MSPPIPRRALTAVALGAAGASLAVAAPAAAAPITGGAFQWDTVNTFGRGGSTWLGYVTSPFLARGTGSPIAPATGDVASTGTAQGSPIRWTLPATALGSDYDPVTRSATLDFDGGVSYTSPPSTGHDFDVSVEDPTITLTGDRGRMVAVGTRTAGGEPGAGGATTGGTRERYGREKAVFDLDLSGATRTYAAGTTTISGIVPSIAETGHAYPATYAKGAGPDRTPNTFGSFTLRLEGTTPPPEPPAPAEPPPAQQPPAAPPAAQPPAAAPPASGGGSAPTSTAGASGERFPSVLSRGRLTSKHVIVRSSRPGTLTARIHRQRVTRTRVGGTVRTTKRWVRVRTLERERSTKGTARMSHGLRTAGAYRIVVRLTDGDGVASKALIVKGRVSQATARRLRAR